MANEVNIYTPRYLAEVVRQAPPVHTFFLDTFFTKVKTFDTESIDIDIKKGDRKMAAFVHPVIGGKVMDDIGYKTETYKAPLINPSKVTTADKLMNRLPGETLYSGKTPAQRAAEKQAEEYTELEEATTRREEWMAVKAIMDGQIHVIGEGVDEVIDFGFTNKKTLTGTAKWGGSAAKIQDNLEDWESEVLVNGLTNVDMCVMGKDALKAFLADENIQKQLDNRRVEMGLIHPKDLPNGVRYIGHLNKPNIDIYEYREVFVDDWTTPGTETTQPMIDDNKVLLISSTADYMRAYGALTYIDEGGSWVTAESNRVLRSYIEHHPDRRMLELMARPLPIPDKADSWLVATVC